MLRDRNTPDDVARMENLEELTRAVAESQEAGESFTDFLDAAALVSDADSFEDKPGVTLITLHSTKGLEFDHVFLSGLEEGICPHSRSINEDKGIEEERRLVYVGMTRARNSLTLTRAVYRRIFGNEQQMRASLPSRFLGGDTDGIGGYGARLDGGNRASRGVTNPTRSIRIRRRNLCVGRGEGRFRHSGRRSGARRRVRHRLVRRRSSAGRMRTRCWGRKCGIRSTGSAQWSESRAKTTTGA